MKTLPPWAKDEDMQADFISALSYQFQSLSIQEREDYRQMQSARFGRFAEIICDLAAIKADAPTLLRRRGN